jgi:hypothetical protein
MKMNHIDEGTIHAWLDGALSAERAREVEAHVASCAECSAAVAEARGLIAGASRILMALDDVPANVVPKRAPAPAVPRGRRQWRAAPWVTGIAAALVLAIGLSTWNRDGTRMMQRGAASTSTAGADASAPETAQLEAVAPPSAPSPVAGAAPAPVRATSPSVAASAPLRSQEAKATVGDRRDAPAEKPTARKIELARGVASGKVAADRASPTAAAVDSDNVERQARVASGPEVVARDTARLRRNLSLAEVAVTAAPSVGDSTAAIAALSGCYRLASAPEARAREEKSLTQRAAAAAGAAARVQPSAPAPLRERADFAEQRPSIVRLDTVRAGVGLRANDARSSSYLGTWERVGDSVRVNLLAYGVFTIAARDSVSCP